MASKSWSCLFSMLPPLAKWSRQLGVATVIAASLLLLAAEASAQAPLVTIQTRVVTNSSPNPYSTLVGTTPYGATGAGPGYHVVVLNRTTLALVSNTTYGLDSTSLNSLSNGIMGLGDNVLVVISSIGPVGSLSPQAIAALNTVAANLGGTGKGYIYGGTMSPSAYSLIGVPGLGAAHGSANQVSIYADPDTNGNISGVLIPDVNSNYTFTYSQFVEVQTITPPGDTITIGPLTSPPTTPASFKAPPFAGSASAGGGFHVLIVKRTTLNHIATDPSVVIWHSSYHTNASDASLAASETHRMASDLIRFPNGLQTGNLIFIISTLGCNSGFSSASALADVETINGVLSELGGAGLFGSNPASIGYYSIIGIPNSGSATRSPEVRSWATPQLSDNITAVLQQNNRGLFTPVNVSAAAGVTLDLSLLPTALAPPSQWPVAAHGSDAVCPTGDDQCAAYKWISCQLIFANPVACINFDIRGTKYTDLTFSLSTALAKLSTLPYPSQPTTAPPGFSFSRKAFNQVQEQLESEIQFAMDVQAWFANVKEVFNDLAITGDLSLQAAITTVQSDVQLPQSTTLPFNVVGVTRDAVMIATVVAGAVQPELVPGFALLNAGLYLGMQFNNASSGASGNQFVTEETNLFNQIQTAFNSAIYGHGILETIVLTDWNKLQTIGTKIEDASSSSSAWFFGTTTEGDLVTAATNAYKVSFYQALMAAKYQMVNFVSVPFSDPSSYNYETDCQISMGTKFCSCSGQIYSPPSGAFSTYGSGPYNILMAVSPIDGSYPSNTLTTKLFTTMHLYSQDFFSTARGWSGIKGALPQKWSEYLNNGACTGLTTPKRQVHGLPGPVLAQRLFRPFMALSANAKKGKPLPGSCS